MLPPGPGGAVHDWFAQKSCPNTGTGAQPSTCGTTGATAACKGCAGYPSAANKFCAIGAQDSVTESWCYDSTAGQNLALTMGQNGSVTLSGVTSFQSPTTCTTGTCNALACTGSHALLTRNDTYEDWTGYTGGNCMGFGNTCYVNMGVAQNVTANYLLSGSFRHVSGQADGPLVRGAASIVDAKGGDFTIIMDDTGPFTVNHTNNVCNNGLVYVGTPPASITCARNSTMGTGSLLITHVPSGATRTIAVTFF